MCCWICSDSSIKCQSKITVLLSINLNFTLIPDSLLQFVKIKDAYLDSLGKSPLNQKNATPEACSAKCLSYSNCLSIEVENGSCFLSTKSAASSNTLKAIKKKDYYQRIKRNYPLYFIIMILSRFF